MRYNCTILDLYDRSVIASVHGRNITAELGIKALEAAISQHPWVLKNGVMNGVGGGLFEPNGETTRAMLVMVL